MTGAGDLSPALPRNKRERGVDRFCFELDHLLVSVPVNTLRDGPRSGQTLADAVRMYAQQSQQGNSLLARKHMAMTVQTAHNMNSHLPVSAS